MEPVLLYITCAHREEANLLCRELVGSRLVACASIIEHATSFYWWQGEIQQEQELIIIAKTLASEVEAVTARVTSLHSYDCPCVVAVPMSGGNPDYLDWLRAQIGPRQD